MESSRTSSEILDDHSNLRKHSAPGEDRTHDLQMARAVIMRLTRYLLRYGDKLTEEEEVRLMDTLHTGRTCQRKMRATFIFNVNECSLPHI